MPVKPGMTASFRPVRAPAPSLRRRRCTASRRRACRRVPSARASSVTMMRAPDAPIGWPSAQAPPLTLTMSCESLSSSISAIGTTAKASLTSHRSTSLDLPAGLLQQLLDRADRRGGEPVRLLRVRGVADDARERLAAQALGASISRHQHQRRGAVVDRRRRGGGDRAVLLERGLERAGSCRA